MNILQELLALEHEAEQFGFKWDNTKQIMAQIQSECLEIQNHLDDFKTEMEKEKLQEEIGDLLHAVFSLTVFCKFDPKKTLELSVAKFKRRLIAVKQIANEQGLTTLQGRSFQELMVFWDQAKILVG